jgi:hypothetical protein
VAALRKTIITFFEAAMVDDQIVLPYAKQGLLGDVYDNARVEGSRPAQRHCAPAKNALRFVSSIADRSVLPLRTG